MGKPSRGSTATDPTSPVLIDLSDAVPPSTQPSESAMDQAGPGWYYDPTDQAVYRYWDGRSWTDHSSDVFLTTAPSDN